jgi:hypothetical protein
MEFHANFDYLLSSVGDKSIDIIKVQVFWFLLLFQKDG